MLPGVIVACPVVTALFLAAPESYSMLNAVYTKGAISAGLLFLFSFIVRSMGRRAELILWRSWGGPPTTRALRWSDGSRSSQWKQKLHLQVLGLTGIGLLTPSEEAARPAEADRLIQDACALLRSKLRGAHSASLVQKANIEYGFARNLYGSRWLWMAGSAVGVIISLWAWQAHGNGLAALAFLLSLALLAAAVAVGFLILPGLVKHIADRYAEEFWSVVAMMPPSGSKQEKPNG